MKVISVHNIETNNLNRWHVSDGKYQSYHSHFAESSFSWWIFLLLYFNLKATIFFFKFWSVIMTMHSHLWICWEVVTDRSLWLILLYPHALFISWVLSIWLILPVTLTWCHRFVFISIFLGWIWSCYLNCFWFVVCRTPSEKRELQQHLFIFTFFVDGNSWIGLSNSNYTGTGFFTAFFFYESLGTVVLVCITAMVCSAHIN